jgi:glycosyltransferase involved in cell wall biosynthesis
MTNKKIKVLTISDHPLSPSGVGTQTKYMIEGLLKTGKYQVISLGGAITHQDYNPMKTEEWGDDWTIFPVDHYGNPDIIRSVLRRERPDILWFMTDPRFWGWLWQMEDEIRPLVPMVYYHVWDNYPPPKFNRLSYDSNDLIVTISRLTNDIVNEVVQRTEVKHLPHAVNTEIFKKIDSEEVLAFRQQSFEGKEKNPNRMVFFWNNRNARRKQSGTLVYWFKEFLDKVGHDNACLILHTDPKDQHGQDLEAIVKELGVDGGQVLLSRQKVPAEGLSMLYNMADCTINISDAEGFGLATLESLACETPILVNMTGGLQEQVTDGENWFGIGLEPCSKAVIGSQEIPYIYEDRLNKEEFINALETFYNKTAEERATLGSAGREHVLKNYSFDRYETEWNNILSEVHEKYGSWENRKNYRSWRAEEL